MSPTEPRPRPSLVLLAIVGLALAVGAAASLIAGAAAAPSFHSGGATEILVSTGFLWWTFLVLFGVTIGVVLWVRFGSGPLRTDSRLAVTALAVILLGLVFFVLLGAFGNGGGGFGGFGGGSGPNSNASSGNGNPGSNLTGPGGRLTLFSLPIPSWGLFAVVAVILLVVGAVAVPRALAYAAARKRDRATGRPTTREVEEVRAALAAAALELELGNEPRQVVIGLYATVLRRVGPMVGGVDGDTPEEIRALHLVRLGIRPSAAETLTRLFEEARYSSHPMGSDAAARATDAIREARDDLDRVPVTA